MLEIILIIVLILFLFGGGYGYHQGVWGGAHGYPAVGGFLVMILIILLIVWLLGPLHAVRY